MDMYLPYKFEVSSKILTSNGGNYTSPLPTSKRTPKKPTQIRVKYDLLYDLLLPTVGPDKLCDRC